jgi:hypothetical protein
MKARDHLTLDNICSGTWSPPAHITENRERGELQPATRTATTVSSGVRGDGRAVGVHVQ